MVKQPVSPNSSGKLNALGQATEESHMFITTEGEMLPKDVTDRDIGLLMAGIVS